MPLDCKRNARNQPAAAQGHDHRVDIVEIFDDLKATRPLTGDDVTVVDRIDDGQAFFAFQAVR